MPQQVTDGIDFGVCQIKALDVCLGGSQAGQSGLLVTPPSSEGRDSSLMLRGGVRSALLWGVEPSCQALILQDMVQFMVQTGFCGNSKNRHQHRTKLQQDHRPRYGHQQQLGLGSHHEPGWQHSPLRLAWAQQQLGPWTPSGPQMVVQTLGSHMVFHGNRSHEHQHRPWTLLPLSHTPHHIFAHHNGAWPLVVSLPCPGQAAPGGHVSVLICQVLVTKFSNTL